MLNIFTLQSGIAQDIVDAVKSDTNFSLFNIVYNQACSFDESNVPAIQVYVSDNTNSSDESERIEMHSRLFTLVFRVYLPETSTDTLESISDSIFNIVFDKYKTQRITARIGNPSYKRLFEDTNSVLVADLEIPIFYTTKQS